MCIRDRVIDTYGLPGPGQNNNLGCNPTAVGPQYSGQFAYSIFIVSDSLVSILSPFANLWRQSLNFGLHEAHLFGRCFPSLCCCAWEVTLSFSDTLIVFLTYLLILSPQYSRWMDATGQSRLLLQCLSSLFIVGFTPVALSSQRRNKKHDIAYETLRITDYGDWAVSIIK